LSRTPVITRGATETSQNTATERSNLHRHCST